MVYSLVAELIFVENYYKRLNDSQSCILNVCISLNINYTSKKLIFKKRQMTKCNKEILDKKLYALKISLPSEGIPFKRIEWGRVQKEVEFI